MHLSFSQFLIQVRLGRACQLLMETDAGIAEACYHRALHALEAHPREPGSAQARMAEFQVAMHAYLDELEATRPNRRPQLEELE